MLAGAVAGLLASSMPVAMATNDHLEAWIGPFSDAIAPSFERLANSTPSGRDCPALLRHSFTPIQGGAPQSLCHYQGKVLLVVNTASQCGYTYQYEGLEALYRKFKDRGLVVIGFPSNDFGGQEPGTNKDIAEFCRTVYGVQFPMYEKQSVGKLAANPLYGELVARTGQAPKWNFHKYVIDRTGARVTSFKSDTDPDSRELVGLIERLLAERPPAERG
jgi:glutathione peroxidase